MISRMKKFFLFLLALLMVACVAGCGNESANQVHSYGKKQSVNVKLTFFGNKADESNVHTIEKIMAGYMQSHPGVVITYESIKGVPYYATLDRRMQHSSGDDIFMADHDAVLKLRSAGMLADLSGLSTVKNYTEMTKTQFTEADGKIYWLPATVSAFGLYCNLDVLKEHNQKVPKNLREFRQVCDYFVSRGITPVVANNDISLKTIISGVSYYDIYQNGEMDKLVNNLNNGTVKLGTSMTDGVKLVNSFIRSGYISPAEALKTRKTSDDLKIFAEGRQPFMLTGAWGAERLQTDFNVKFKYAVYPLPILEKDAIVIINPDVRLCVNARSKHLQEAKKFVEYFTQAQNIHDFCIEQCSANPQNDKLMLVNEELKPVAEAYAAGKNVLATYAKLKLPTWTLTREATSGLLRGESVERVIEDMNVAEQKYL